jgi:chromosome segregation ATPase
LKPFLPIILIINMEEELQRIRGKDYSQIDQNLFENMGRADDLSATLTQLSDFQRFLMAQIASLNDPQSTPAQALKKSIAKNIDVLRESLVQCSRMRERNDLGAGEKIGEVRRKVGEVRAEVKEVKREVRRRVKEVVEENGRMWERGMKQIVERYAQLEQEKGVVESRNAQLGQENRKMRDQMVQLEGELKLAKAKCEQLEREKMQPIFVRNTHTPTPSLTFEQLTLEPPLKTEGDHLRTPLR